ncbi:uncharacterized protein SOCG_01069 [Schizosaccharomyces octosporus yFS286]|uniref:Uncharacterized protein n=1 Tax=Schizosaccharomyces octosporus (strain yFS286) TaxID=483514 RepID=S9Q0S7_SCHOY|nr:uncharacterized protein SOCG_01069 [Schizosaccharomyces octosporus yFS286]EPX73318.1 hypothetical protein SOCG_01069 [Schizosaccharomyces octosporus yFS286]
MLVKTLLENLERRLQHLELIMSLFDPNQLKYLREMETRLLESNAYHELYNEYKNVIKASVSCSEKRNPIFELELSNLEALLKFFIDIKKVANYDQTNFTKDFLIFLNEHRIAFKQFIHLQQLLNEHHELLKRTIRLVVLHYIEPTLFKNNILQDLSLRLRRLERRVQIENSTTHKLRKENY